MNFSLSKWRRVGGQLGLLFLVGFSLSKLERPPRYGAAGESASVNGFRELWADLRWVGAYRAWHARDGEKLRQELQWVTMLNPEPLGFWLNGARMLGYDMAAWRKENVSDARLAAAVNREQLEEALNFLRRAAVYHPERAAIPIEEAVLSLHLIGSERKAIDALERAQRCADTPAFVPRVRAELLVRVGRLAEARAILRQALVKSEVTADEDAKSLLRMRIAEIDQQLSL